MSSYLKSLNLNNLEILHFYSANEKKTKNVTWFPCTKRKKCVHEKSRCDLHPHKDCIYNNTQGQMVAEDEENCLQAYKEKSLIPQTANFECISPIHNSNSSAILSTVSDWTTRKFEYNAIGGKYLVFVSSRSVKMRGFSFLSLHAF